ncbi:MAG: DUF3137 domain-containing protein [Verrucomicrobiota bacterium]
MVEVDKVMAAAESTLQSLEETRQLFFQKRKKALGIVGIALGAGAVLGIVLGFSVSYVLTIITLVIAGIASGIVYAVMTGGVKGQYIDSYKSTVVEKLVTQIDPQLHYYPNDGISRDLFGNSELFTYPDRYRTEDLIKGNYGDTFLYLAEIHAEEKKERRDKDGKRETYYVDIFKGLMLIADFHKDFHGRTFVFPDSGEKTFGGFARFFQKMGGRKGTSLIQLEDVEFEEAFAVHSTDEVESRYILSSSMLRRFLSMRQRFGSDVRVAFKESNVIIAVPHKHPYLEPKIKTPATDAKQVRDMLFEMKYFLDLVEELNLNTRIWTKD